MPELRIAPFTSRARVALAIARAIAAGRGDADVTPLHVALGLLREGENAAVAALAHAGAAIRSLRRDMEAELGLPPGGTRPREVTIPLTPSEQHVVVLAEAASHSAGDEYIGPEHLLLAVLAEESSKAALLFARHGINTENARTHLAAIMHKHP